MAVIYRCDRCKKISETASLMGAIEIVVMDNELKYHICDACMERIIYFLKNPDTNVYHSSAVERK